MRIIEVKTQKKEEFIDITSRIKKEVENSGIENGMCVVYIPHTTSGVTINESADPSVKEDIVMTMKKLIPDSLPYSHAEGNSPAHIKSSLIGSSVNIIIHKGNLSLGTWQGIFFCEFDGPRNRKVFIKISS
ncbi:MAG: secondary thiamine-phosphate synthase enzyme YjbQ [Candidatus Aminicenantaceae bacterium]